MLAFQRTDRHQRPWSSTHTSVKAIATSTLVRSIVLTKATTITRTIMIILIMSSSSYVVTDIGASEATIGDFLKVRFIVNKNIQQDITYLVREALGEKQVGTVFLAAFSL